MRILSSPTFWVIVVAVAVAVVIMVVRARTHGEWGFKEVVKDPERWNAEMERENKALTSKLEKAQQWNEAQISVAVNRFIFEVSSSQEAIMDYQVLKSLGARTHSALFRILSDASRRARLVAPTGENLVPEAPFNRVCKLLGDTPPNSAAVLVGSFLDEPNNEVRKDAALVLGKIGTPEVVIPLRRAFADSDEYVRSYGLMGLQWAIKQDRIDAQCARELFEDIAQLVISGKNHDESAALLLRMDRTKATNLFLSEKFFAPGTPSLHEALEALADERISVPRERVLALIADLEKGEMKYPETYVLGESLRLLGQHKLTEDRAFLEARTSHGEPRVAEGAAAGLIALCALEGFEKRVWEMESKSGFAALKPAQRQYLAVQMYDAEVNNGGLSQYFFNSSGDYWQDALAGLEAMGFHERLAVLREAVAKFGKEGPSQDRERRQKQLAKLERRNDATFDPLDDRYYKCKEVIDVWTKRFVLKNADAFK